MLKDVMFACAMLSFVSCQRQQRRQANGQGNFELTFNNAHDILALQTRCPACYACIYSITGQDVPTDCMDGDLNEMLSCAEQMAYIYDWDDDQGQNISTTSAPPPTTASAPTATPAPAIRPPCVKQCRVCVEDLDSFGFDVTRPQRAAWDEWYPDLFVQTDDPDDIPDDPVRRKREVDGDACCETDRTVMSYTGTYLDNSGETWYPVWFYDTTSATYSVQRVDTITCPSSKASCDSNLDCREHVEIRTFLMSRFIPDPTLGHFLIVLSHPNADNSFIDVDVPAYCKCVYTN